MELVHAVAVREFADGPSVTQTRFATTDLPFLRALHVEDLSDSAAQGTAAALAEPLTDELLGAGEFYAPRQRRGVRHHAGGGA